MSIQHLHKERKSISRDCKKIYFKDKTIVTIEIDMSILLHIALKENQIR